MANVKKVGYYYVSVPDKPGMGAEILTGLKDAGVNLLAFHAFPYRRRAQLDFVPEDDRAFKAAMKKMGHQVSRKKTAFLVVGRDKAGAGFDDLVGPLAEAGVNLKAMDAVVVGKRYGALFWIDPSDIRKATRVLEAE